MTRPSLLSQVRSGRWLDKQEFPELQYAVAGLVPEGFGLVVAPPKAGKSWFVLNILLDIARGVPTLGGLSTGPERPVLYLALEDGDRRLQHRARELLDGAPIPAKFDYVTKAKADEVAPLISEWLETHGGSAPLVVLDTLGKILPATRSGESAYQRDYRIGSTLKELADDSPGTTLLAVHHTRKMVSEDFMDSVSGTNGLNGSADFTLLLNRARNSDRGELKVTGRDVAEGEYALTMSCGRWKVTGEDLAESRSIADSNKTQAKLSAVSLQVLSVVRDAPEGTITPMRVAEAIPEMTNDQASTYLKRLVRYELISQISRGIYGPVQPVSEEFEVFDQSNTELSFDKLDCLSPVDTSSGECPPVERVSARPRRRRPKKRLRSSRSDRSNTSHTRVTDVEPG